MAVLEATYTPTAIESSYYWVQTIETNVPGSGQTSPYVDIQAQSPPNGTPIYPNDPRSTSTRMVFSDTPERTKPLRPNSVSWIANLFLVSYTPGANGGMGGNIVVRDGIRWGFTLVPDPIVPSTNITTDGPSSAQAVPEPATWLALLPSALLLRRKKGKVASC